MTQRQPFTLHPFYPDPELPPLYAIIPDDGHDGYIIGELHEVEALRDQLSRLIDDDQHDGKIDHLDERLGWPWLSVTEAAEKFDVPLATVRYACASGHIAGAQKQRGRWRFAQPRFLYWLTHRPKRGPKKKGDET